MSTSNPTKIIVNTPGGLARVTSAGLRYGLKVVNVRMLGTGSPWSYERHQVTVVEVRR